MRKLALSLFALCVLTVPVIAGVIDGTPVIPPPPCRQDCGASTAVSVADALKVQVALLLIRLHS